MTTSFQTASIVVLSLNLITACDAVDSEAVNTSHPSQISDCPTSECGSNVLKRLRGKTRSLKIDGSEANDEKYQITGMKKNGIDYGFTIVDGSIVGQALDGESDLEGWALEGASIYMDGPASEGSSEIVTWEILIKDTKATPYWDDPNEMFDMYSLQYKRLSDPVGSEVPMCNKADDIIEEEEWVSVFMGKIDDTGTRLDVVPGTESDWFNFACEYDVLHKTTGLGYSPGTNATTPAEWETTIDMVTAQYCDSSEPFTRVGAHFRYQAPHLYRDDILRFDWGSEPVENYPIEAVWTENGLGCLNEPRYMSRSDVEARCGIIDRCDADSDNDGSTNAEELQAANDYIWTTYRVPWTVCKSDSEPVCEYTKIQDAIDAAEPGTYINIKAGEYFENIVVKKPMYIMGEGRDKTIVNGSASGSVFTIPHGVVVSLHNMSVVNGSAETGGGIHNDGELYVANLDVRDNIAHEGAGIHTDSGECEANSNHATRLVIDSSRISNNRATFNGGGIWAGENATVKIGDTIVTYNSAPLEAGGGGIYNNGATMSLDRSHLRRNQAGTGAALEVVNRGSIEMTNVNISGNTSLISWAAVMTNGSDGTVLIRHEVTFQGNQPSNCSPSDDGEIHDPLGHCEKTVPTVVAGNSHTCALLSTGKVRCWGSSDLLGYGNTNNIGDDETPASAGYVDVADHGDTVVQLVAGSSHTCALLSTGKVRCWGWASSGRLGYGNTNNIGDDETPASVGYVDVTDNGDTVVQLVVGWWHTCALLSTGKVRCWGDGRYGQLGYGNTDNIGDDETPASAGDVDVGGSVTQLTANRMHTCALLSTGKVRCWGDGSAGQLGYGNTDNIGDDETPASAGDVDVGGLVTQLTAGAYDTCALLAEGSVRCWGFGVLGYPGGGIYDYIGDDEPPASAGDIDIADAGDTVVKITSGEHHRCALLSTGKVRCWGEWLFGPLGYTHHNGNIGDDETPASVGDIDIGGSVVDIDAGSWHTCAVLNTGAIRCWGDNYFGQLGYGHTNDIGDNETPESAGDVDFDRSTVKLDAGGSHTCALLSSSTLRCWGEGTSGQLGYPGWGDVGDNEHPVDAGDVVVGGPVVQFSAGGSHTCAILASGAVRCWGYGGDGQLGYGNTSNVGLDKVPGNITNPVDLGGTAIQISTGGRHTCTLLDDDAVRCWGDNASGQLGYGNTVSIGDNETPTSVGNVDVGGPVMQLATGDAHTCALLATGAVRCWGQGAYGALGLGHTADIHVPSNDVKIGGPVNQIVAGDHHTCALLSTGTVQCWGKGSLGQLGNGSTDNIGDDEVPAIIQPIQFVNPVVELTAGGSHTCARMSTGTVRCWGEGMYGAPGYGDAIDVNAAANTEDVDIGSPVVQVTAGGSHTCALLSTGSARCWGEAANGRLGNLDVFNNIGDDEVPASMGDIAIANIP